MRNIEQLLQISGSCSERVHPSRGSKNNKQPALNATARQSLLNTFLYVHAFPSQSCKRDSKFFIFILFFVFK